MDKPNFHDRCYKTKDDKRHSTIWGVDRIANETPEARENRLKTLRENRGTWVWDSTKRKLVRKEEYYSNPINTDVPQVSMWNPEWTVVSTGRRMSKGELKAYCKANNKHWENA